MLSKCLLIEVESPVGFSLVNWWAWEKLQYQETDCKRIIHHGLLGRNFSTGSLHGASEGRTQEKGCTEVWLQPLYMSLGYQVEVNPQRPLCFRGAELWQLTLETSWILITVASYIHLFLVGFLLSLFLNHPMGKLFSSTKMLVYQLAAIWQW